MGVEGEALGQLGDPRLGHVCLGLVDHHQIDAVTTKTGPAGAAAIAGLPAPGLFVCARVGSRLAPQRGGASRRERVWVATTNRTSAEMLALLRAHKLELVDRFGIAGLALFGSAVRDEAHPASDVDILVRFEGPADSRRYFGVQFYREDLLGTRVDLVTDKALRSELRPYVEAEAVDV